jgi:peptidoglycan/xylan/chitin deacetylase (PgdA/CDA1 family)
VEPCPHVPLCPSPGSPAPTSARRRALRRLLTPLLLTGLAVGASAPAQAAQATAGIVTTTQHEGRYVALTFDDGPNPPDTYALLAVLKKHHVKATFCLWGDHVVQHPEVARAITRDGHRLCNHTMHHDNLAGWSPEQIRADLVQTSAVIREIVPTGKIDYFRAPFGAWGPHSAQVAADLGMQPLGWQSLIFDWENRTAEDLTQQLLDAAQPGAVILAHDGGGDRRATVQAIDRAIPVLKAQGFRFDRPEKPGKVG